MELMLDTANLKEIEYYNNIFPIIGVTSNPSILKKEGYIDVFEHLKTIREIIGRDKSLHVQLITDKSEEMIQEAYKIAENLGEDTYIKIPLNIEGLKTIKVLKKEDFKITATAIYTAAQGDFSIMAGADYIAPYFNRMENNNIHAAEVIHHFASLINTYNKNTKILAASFKNIGQVVKAYANGAHCATVDPEILSSALELPAIDNAILNFQKDWEGIHGENITFKNL